MAFIVSTAMLLRQRATEPEHFDDPARTADEISAGYQELARVNRLFHMHDPYTRVLSRWLGPKHCARLSILDLGAGDGWLGAQMEEWARQLGWQWQVTNLDLNPVPLRLNAHSRNVAGTALALPFPSDSFDVAIASQMTHHLDDDAEVIQHFREAYRVARLGVFITDMKRSPFLYGVLWIALRLLGITPRMRQDGLISVKRSWRKGELRELAGRAGLRGATVQSYFGTRLIVAAKKAAATDGASETTAACRETDESCSVHRHR
jgi:ubiquinone/menaquinone biosynthesis C-methylase UbiE